MKKDTTCSLCSGPMVMHDNVSIQAGGSNVLQYTRAWVCTHCSAAFPIAVEGGFLRRVRPLYEDENSTE